MKEELHEVHRRGQVHSEVEQHEEDPLSLDDHQLVEEAVAFSDALVDRENPVLVELDGDEDSCDADELQGALLYLGALAQEQIHVKDGLDTSFLQETILLTSL